MNKHNTIASNLRFAWALTRYSLYIYTEMVLACMPEEVLYKEIIPSKETLSLLLLKESVLFPPLNIENNN